MPDTYDPVAARAARATEVNETVDDDEVDAPAAFRHSDEQFKVPAGARSTRPAAQRELYVPPGVASLDEARAKHNGWPDDATDKKPRPGTPTGTGWA